LALTVALSRVFAGPASFRVLRSYITVPGNVSSVEDANSFLAWGNAQGYMILLEIEALKARFISGFP
jgi:hypothetical protein